MEIHILVIDNDKETIVRLKQWLPNVIIKGAGNFASGLACIEKNDLKLIVLSENLPNISLTKALQQILSIKQVPIICLANSNDDCKSVKFDVPINSMYVKPLNKELIIQHFLSYLNLGQLSSKSAAPDKRKTITQLEAKEYINNHLIGSSPQLMQVKQDIMDYSLSDATVLITGETGTGKEIVANLIHTISQREGLYNIVNCSAIPEKLAESELFGHTKGAFTDAKFEKKGFCESSHKGTLFLDEIGDMDMALQPKLLRFLEEKAFYQVGSTTRRDVDVRIISATHHNLAQKTRQSSFRKDLYYRLNQLAINLPPLRERKEDIIELSRYFLNQQQDYRSLAGFSINNLLNHNWPGNVRELLNIIYRARIISKGSTIEIPEKLFI